MSFVDRARALLMQDLAAQDFHAGKSQKDTTEYWAEAERQIESMDNLALLDLIGRTLEPCQ